MLASLSALYFFVPLLDDVLLGYFSATSRILYLGGYIAVLLAASSIVDPKGNAFRFALGGTLVSALLGALYIALDYKILHILSSALMMWVIVRIILSIIGNLYNTKEVTVYTILGALCAYLLIGLLWSLGYTLIDDLDPHAFDIPASFQNHARLLGDGNLSYINSLYYSLVTLTTLGFGDITPVSTAAKMMTTAEAVVGQIFLVVNVARLVGIYSNKTPGSAQEENES